MSGAPPSRSALPVHAFVFVGAVLLFGLEPLVGRLLLPRFGGAFHVWTTALMFFQGALFVAYAYAHLLAGRLGRWHLLVVALPLAFLPPTVGDGPVGAADAGAILVLLLRHVAVPFVVLATTAVVAQRWWARSGREPYGLYAVSNAGSLGALLLYALAVEPLVGLSTQRWSWTVGYVVYLGLAFLAWRAKGPPASAAPLPKLPPAPRPRPAALLYWAVLSAAPSAFLMAVTNLIALDAGSVPLVWIVPLALYLGSFVVAFASPRDAEAGTRVPGPVRRLWPHVAAVGLFFFSGGEAGGGWVDVAVHLGVLAFVALAAHGELYRARPAPRHLTLYYLVIALGGWLGGAVVALLAPVAFDGLWEYPLALAALALALGIGRREALCAWLRTAPRLALVASAALVLVIVGKVAYASSSEDASETLAVRRSFYGLYRVIRTPRGEGAVRDLVSGSTRHGRQREGDLTPLSYYHPAGPLGDALATVASPRRLGVVGLGVGAAAGHLAAGDRARFFEIDPAVAELARAHFGYLRGAPGATEVVVGDARVSLERERDEAPPYDLLLVDAFAGDAIPTHLLTLEAFALYRARLAPDGLLLLHVSNRYYDLRPVLRANAERLGLVGAHVARLEGLAPEQDPSRYVALARRPARLAGLLARGWRRLSETPALAGAAPWTDDHVDVLEALVADW
jgi:hypothetical protein